MRGPLSPWIPPVAAVKIWCRTSELTPSQHLATVCAIPEGEGDMGGALRSETRLFASGDLAQAECRKMASAMKRRLADEGHQIVAIELV